MTEQSKKPSDEMASRATRTRLGTTAKSGLDWSEPKLRAAVNGVVDAFPGWTDASRRKVEELLRPGLTTVHRPPNQ